MKMLVRFAPFIAFATVSAYAGWRIAAPAGLVILLAVVAFSVGPVLADLERDRCRPPRRRG